MVKAEGIRPVEAAKKIAKLTKRVESKTFERALTEVQNKQASSGSVQRKSEPADEGSRIVREAYDKYRKTGSTEALTQYMTAKKKYGK